MRMRMVILASLGILLAQSVVLSQQMYGEAVEPNVPASQEVVTIVQVKHYPVEDLARILDALSIGEGTHVFVDGNANRLIVQASPQRLKEIVRLVEQLDVPNVSQPTAQYLAYRIYMLELPSEHLGLRPFSIGVKGSAQLPPERILNAGLGNQVQIEKFYQDATDDGQWQFRIGGRAASNEAIEKLTEKIPDCQIMQLEWEDVRPIMLTTRVAPLPQLLQDHIRKLLGDGVGIVGYWFGNLSVPGRVEAPIGPWSFELGLDRSSQRDEVELEISVVRQSQDDPSQTWQILSNSMRCKVDRPVIIGYNRDNHGVETMGALVIIPEADTQPIESQPKENSAR